MEKSYEKSAVKTLPADAFVFFEVFGSVRFPLIACDLRRLSWGLGSYPRGPSYLGVPLELAPPERRLSFSAAIGGFLSAIEPDEYTAAVLHREIGELGSDLAAAFAEW